MLYTAIYQDQYAVDRPTLDDDLAFLSELACAHLTHYLSTPASSMTWSPAMAGRIKVFLTHVATKRPKVKPSAVLRTILVIARYQKENPEIVAYNDEAELLFYIAFTKVARRFDPNFHNTLALSFMDASEDMARRFGFFDEQVDDEVEAELHPKQRDMTAAKVLAALEFFLAPLVDEKVRRGLGGGNVTRCPTMPLMSPLKPVIRDRAQQKPLFPVVPYEMRIEQRLSSIIEEDEDEDQISISEGSFGESALDASLNEPSLFDFLGNTLRTSTSISTMRSNSSSKSEGPLVDHHHSPILGTPSSSSGASFYSAVETLSHTESTSSSFDSSIDTSFSLQSIDSTTTHPALPPEKEKPADIYAHWKHHPDSEGNFLVWGRPGLSTSVRERKLFTDLLATMPPGPGARRVEDEGRSWLGGVVRAVKWRLGGASRNAPRSMVGSSNARKVLFHLGFPIDPRSRCRPNV